MAENILNLKKRAVEAGMSKADAMKADRKTLDAFFANNASEGAKGGENKVIKKKVVAKKKATPAKVARKTTKKAPTPAKPARAKKTEKPSTKKATRKPVKRAENTDGFGRLSIGSLDWTATSEDWNPKVGGPVEKLFKALKRTKGNIDKAYEIVKSSPHDFVGKTKRDGTRRSKGEVESMLRYRLNRTKYEFAVRTGQHTSADSKNRAAYGTGTYATTRKVKPARKARTNPRKNAMTTKKAPARKATGGKKVARAKK